MIKFAMEVAEEQHSSGRYFIFEHPAKAKSWDLHKLKKMADKDGVKIVEAHQCMYGLEAPTGKSGGGALPAKKPKKFMSNIAEVKEELSTKCKRQHEHQNLTGGRAKAAEKYPEKLCNAICRVVMKLKKRLASGMEKVSLVSRKIGSLNTISIGNVGVDEKDLKRLDRHEETDGIRIEGWDDINMVPLDGEAVNQARQNELGYIFDMNVFRLMPRAEAHRLWIKIISCKNRPWVIDNHDECHIVE